MTKNTTIENPHFKDIDAAIAGLTAGQRVAISLFDKAVQNRAVPLAEAKDVAGLVVGMKPIAYVSKGTVDAGLLKNMHLHRVSINKHVEAYSFDKKALQEFKIAMSAAFGKRNEAAERRVGTLLGYPSTATSYFIKRFGDLDTYPMVIPRSTYRTLTGEFFQDFILSPTHYNDELRDYSEPLEYATSVLLPHVYKKMQRSLRKSQRQYKLDVLLGRPERHSPIPELFV